MKVNRAQAVAIYGLMMNSPVNATMELRPMFISDDLLCRIEHKQDEATIVRLFKLIAEGGTAEADIRTWPEDPAGILLEG